MSDTCQRCGGEHASGDCPDALRTQHAVSQVAIELTQVGAQPEMPPDAGSDGEGEDELAPGTLVGEYEIVRRIGSGGMGSVFQAVHPLIGRKVAIKVLNAIGGASAGAGTRFLQEARTAAMVRHRNIVDVFAFGQLLDGRLYLVMEFLEGETLSDFLDRRGALPFRVAMSILDGVLAGLAVAHAKGVVHRDLKPDNIWLLPPDPSIVQAQGPDPELVDSLRVKLLDFGIAKITAGEGSGIQLTRAGAPIGTPAFMSPEQCRGDVAIDARSDIYALGVLMYQMFTLRLPFGGDTFVEVLHQHLNAPPPSLAASGMPEDLQAVIAMALAKDPADRFPTVAELHQALADCEEAREWSPRQVAAPTERSGAGDETRIRPASEAEEPGGALPAFQFEGLRVEALLAGEALILALAGEIDDGPAVPALAGWLGETFEAARDRLARVVLDVSRLAYAGPQTSQCLAGWIEFLAQARADGLSPTTVIHDESVGWQRAAITALQRRDPALRLETRDRD